MSSVFLYVAIVAIWAFVLVPRWLRRHHAQPRTMSDADVASDLDAEAYEDDDDSDGTLAYPDYAAENEPDPRPAPAVRRPTMTAPPLPRSRMLQARRRLLTALVLLTSVACAATAARLIPWWTCVAPAGVLVCYFLLLRAAAQADTERAQRLAASYARQTRMQASADRRAAAAAAPDAQIIDISSRVGDQLYDQYADAAVRAVGD